MYLIFAPWCPHCHTTMPNFAEASKKTNIPFAIINAESVPSNILQDFKLTHFPFIVKKSNSTKYVFEGQPKVEELVKHAHN